MAGNREAGARRSGTQARVSRGMQTGPHERQGKIDVQRLCGCHILVQEKKMAFPEESGTCGTLYRFCQFTIKNSVPLVVKSTLSRTVIDVSRLVRQMQ